MQCVATLISKWGGRGYSGMPVSKIESFTVDSAMDTDTDQWSFDIGDPQAQLVELLRRDSEVRVGLTLKEQGFTAEPILQGFADTIALRHDGTLSLQGRDITAAAVDDTAIPYQWHQARPDSIIQQQGRERGISKFKVVPVAPIPNLYTDGSESVWAFWYRMIRKKKMWIWAAGDGTLNVGPLNYGGRIAYYFGTPTANYPDPKLWTPVQESEITKNTNTRVGKVWVYGDDGKIGFGPIEAVDATIADWIKKPLHIITADAAHTNRAEALKEAREEIFESIVGSLEIDITIPNPGYVVKQNSIAYLNLPQSGFRGEFFVVGVRVLGGRGGTTQQVRLREKKYALTRRVPKDPKLKEDATNVSASGVGATLATGVHEWGDYFVIAAKAWHGGWPFDLFLATLLAICSHETHFMNVREGNVGGPEWNPPPSPIGDNREVITSQAGKGQTLQEWKADFANVAGNPLNPYSREAGVGPMQLTTASYKHDADAYMNIFDEYVGGRWHPSANIFIGGKVLAKKSEGIPQTEAQWWNVVALYHGDQDFQHSTYAHQIREDVVTNWLPQIDQELKTAGGTLPADSTKTIAQYGSSVPEAVRKIINFCERQEGKPYQWGAAGPDAFDCSGLAIAAYQAGGFPGLPHNTNALWNNGKGYGNLRSVPTDKLLPGDMIMFDIFGDSTDAPPQHMGIFYQDNTMIVAPHTGDVVKVESIISDSWRIMGGLRERGLWPTNVTDSTVYDPNHIP